MIDFVRTNRPDLVVAVPVPAAALAPAATIPHSCLLYTSDAAAERSSVDLGGRRIINKKKKKKHQTSIRHYLTEIPHSELS